MSGQGFDGKALEAALERAGDVARAAALQALQRGGRTLLDAAKAKAPQDTGALIESGTSALEPEKLRARVEFTAPYAVVQHEAVNLRHGKGEPKFLERAMAEQAEPIAQEIAATMRGVFSGRR